MYAACFTISGWAGPQEYIFSGNKLIDIMNSFNDVQDIMCLAMMAEQQGHENSDDLEKLMKLAMKYESGKVQAKDIESFDVSLSIGHMKCNELMKGKDPVTELIKKYPGAIVR